MFDPFAVVTVDLTVSDAALASLARAPRAYVPCKVSFVIDGSSSPPLEAGLRVKGRYGSSRPLSGKAALKLKLDFSVPGQEFLGITKLTLNNMVQDPAMLREALGYSMFRALEVACPRTGYAWVRVNAEDFGLYANIESVDRTFLARFYPETAHLYEGAYGSDVVPGGVGGFEVDEGDPADLSDLLALIDAAQADDATWLTDVAPYVDLEQMARMWLIEQYIGHWDGYAPTINNFFLHADGDGRFTMLPWGLDQTFSDRRNIYAGKGHLFARCMQLKPCRDRYDATLSAAIAVLDALDPVSFVESLAAYLRPWVVADPRREYDAETVGAQVLATLAFLRDRRASMGALAACLADPESDRDGDGYRCQWDCDEANASIHRGAPEVCGDGVDQSCSGVADDGYDCPDCITVHRGPTRYLFCTYPRPFEMAAPHCDAERSRLLIVDDAAENRWVRDQAAQLGMGTPWLGLDDRETEGTWSWTDGSSPTDLNWNAGEPNDSAGEDCTQLLSTGLWNDVKCASEFGVVCEDPL